MCRFAIIFVQVIYLLTAKTAFNIIILPVIGAKKQTDPPAKQIFHHHPFLSAPSGRSRHRIVFVEVIAVIERFATRRQFLFYFLMSCLFCYAQYKMPTAVQSSELIDIQRVVNARAW